MVETSLAGAGGRPAVLPRQPCEHLPGMLLRKAVAGISAFAFQVHKAGQLSTPGFLPVWTDHQETHTVHRGFASRFTQTQCRLLFRLRQRVRLLHSCDASFP